MHKPNVGLIFDEEHFTISKAQICWTMMRKMRKKQKLRVFIISATVEKNSFNFKFRDSDEDGGEALVKEFDSAWTLHPQIDFAVSSNK